MPRFYTLSCVAAIAAATALVAGCGARTPLEGSEPAGPVDGGGGRRDGGDGGIGGPCRVAEDCNDGLACNGVESCTAERCVAGTPIACADMTECTNDTCVEPGMCQFVPDSSRCPPGTICDPFAGCTRRACSGPMECDDGFFCNGFEQCGPDGFCIAGDPISCEDGIDCTADFCDEMAGGCVSTLLDRDADGFGDSRCGGEDCDDSNPLVHPFAGEACFDMLDNDCDFQFDCVDSDCFGDPGCGRCRPLELNCSDFIDEDCDGFADCADPDCFKSMDCITPCLTFEICGNGIDDDCNGALDCGDPACFGDPACVCVGPLPTREFDCLNGLDDDCDMLFDCADPDCTGHPACMRPCPDRDLGMLIGGGVARGVTFMTGNDSGGSCGGSGAEEIAFFWTAPTTGAYQIDTIGSSYDTLIYVRLDGCAGREIACDDDAGGSLSSRVIVRLGAGQRIVIFVDGFGSSAGAYQLNIRPGLVTEGGFCSDGIDNDADGATDCADIDCRFEPACCFARREVCDNLVDDNCDMLIDCSDPSCIGVPPCPGGCEPFESSCDNFRDDDCDLRTDCADTDCCFTARCAGSPVCRGDGGIISDGGFCSSNELGVAQCTDRRDNDCDTRADCADTDCSPFGPMGECCDGIDNDGDGLRDIFTCRCFTDAQCAGVGDLDQVCWTRSFSVCAPRCTFVGGDSFCTMFLGTGWRCDAMSGQCISTMPPPPMP